MSAKGSGSVVAAYQSIKDGQVLDSVNLKIDYGLGFDMHYLTSYVRAGLISCTRNPIAFFYYNPKVHSPQDVDRHMEEYAKAASDARNERIQEGKSFEQEFYEFLGKYGDRLVFYLKGWKPQLCKKIRDSRDIYDAVCYFRLGFIAGDKIVDIPYQSGEGLVMPVELKANRIDSVSKGVTGDVIDKKYAETKMSFENSICFFSGNPTNSAFRAMEEFDVIVALPKDLRSLQEIAEKTPNPIHKEGSTFKEVRYEILKK